VASEQSTTISSTHPDCRFRLSRTERTGPDAISKTDRVFFYRLRHGYASHGPEGGWPGLTTFQVVELVLKMIHCVHAG